MSAACSAFLAASPRASVQWRVERELDAFEARYAGTRVSARGR